MPTPYNTLSTPSKEFKFQTWCNQTGIGIIPFKMVKYMATPHNTMPAMPLHTLLTPSKEFEFQSRSNQTGIGFIPFEMVKYMATPRNTTPIITMPLRTMYLPTTLNNTLNQWFISEMLLVKILNLTWDRIKMFLFSVVQ